MNMLELKDIHKSYNNFTAVNGITLSIKKQSIYGLLGPNGAGKSTTISMICGLVKKSSGKIIYEEKTDKIRNWKENIGIVPQDFALYWDLTAKENVRFFCSLYGFKGEELERRTKETLEFVGLWDVRDKKASEFSGGMKRRLNIGCAISHSPKLIIMDEPTVGIDPQSRNHILESVLKLRERGATILYTSHYMQEVDDICDEIAIIDQGTIIAQGTSNELKNLISEDTIYNLALNKKVPELENEFKKLSGVHTVSSSDNSYKISAAKTSNIVSEIISVIEKNNGVIKDFSVEEPTLENVFLSLTGKKLRE